MSIIIKNNQFHLKTKNTSYIFSLFNEKYLTQNYWGRAVADDTDMTYMSGPYVYSRANAFHVPVTPDNSAFLSDLKLEFSVVGGGDFRTPTFHACYANGSTVTELTYENYAVYNGKKQLEGLPATYVENETEAQTLEITLSDKLTGLCAVLSYSVFCEYDVITRNVRFENHGENPLDILEARSATVDFYGTNFQVLDLNGDWVRERGIEWKNVGHSRVSFDSKRGMSSHMHNPFIAVSPGGVSEYSGEVYGFSLVYSGSFEAFAEGNSCGGTRVGIGINPFNFDWQLKTGEVFQTPEVVMVHSDCGLNAMSEKYHKIYRERLCRGRYRDEVRPTVINNWEGTYFDFNEKKLTDIAKVGAQLGLEMFVLDDGWFGERNDDRRSLGDWYVNKEKLPGGISGVADEIISLGMRFGLWFEPEMVSPDSDLYRAHPDWCVHSPGRCRTQNRCQLVLDLSRSEVCDYIISAISAVLDSARITYVKWDCNRNLTETANRAQGHKYVLGLYRILETLNSRYPDVLFEGCSGGGGRFDPGMLYYMPQTWTSDNTNPIARMAIQYGTSVVYPPITMAAHVGHIETGFDCENKFMHTCAMVAMSGNFGYELDLSKLSQTEIIQAQGYVEQYKIIRKTVQFGDFYRLESPFEGCFTSFEFVSPKKDEAVLFIYQNKKTDNGEQRRIVLKGLNPKLIYEADGVSYSGEALMTAGLVIPLNSYEYSSGMLVFHPVK